MNSIKQALTDSGVSSQTNTVRLLFRNPLNKGKVILLVEGFDDVNVFEKFFNPQLVQLHFVCNCNEIIRVLNQIEQRYQNRLLAIKDADFDRLKGITYTHTNLFLTDYHDAEMLMLSGYGTMLLAMRYNVNTMQIPSFKQLMQDIESISYLKIYNSIHDLRINFDKPEIASFYTGKSPLDYSSYTINLFGKLANLGKIVAESTIVNFACSLSYDDKDLLQLTNGHDMFDVVYKIIRLNYRQNLRKKDVAREMRRIYTWNRFKKTVLYNSLDKWFTSHNYENVWCN